MKTIIYSGMLSFLLMSTLTGCKNSCSFRYLSDLRAIVLEHNAMVNAQTDTEKNEKHARKEKACQKFWQKHGKEFSPCLAEQSYSHVNITPKFVEDACAADTSATELLPESTHIDS